MTKNVAHVTIWFGCLGLVWLEASEFLGQNCSLQPLYASDREHLPRMRVVAVIMLILINFLDKDCR